MPDVLTLPPACITSAVSEWVSGQSKRRSLTFHLWDHLLASGNLVIEPDEDDPNTTHIIYRLDVTPERHACE